MYRCVSQENFIKYGVEYPTNSEDEIQKSKSSIKKITSFMTPQNQKSKADLSEKYFFIFTIFSQNVYLKLLFIVIIKLGFVRK